MSHELERYALAASYLPARLRQNVLRLSQEQQYSAEEIRICAGRPVSVRLAGDEVDLPVIAELSDLEMLCDLATEFSRYAAIETIRDGYIPVRGGFRIGLCGTAVMKGGKCTNLSPLSSAVIRISREYPGIADDLVPQLFENGVFQNTLILSPPGGGKTTLLRELIRCISDGTGEIGPHRISLIDERGEIGVCCHGIPQLQVGTHTDVLDACPKRIGIPMVLRAMNPQIIAVDEITLPADVQAMCMAAGCGVGLLATIHASCREELHQKPVFQPLIESSSFQRVIQISRSGKERCYHVEVLQ